MSSSLHQLFHAIATTKDEHELRMRFMDSVGDYFKVQRWGIHMFNEDSSYSAVEVYGMPNVDNFIELYAEVGRNVDPVLRYVTERHAPAHEEMVLPVGGWKQCELYQNCCAYYDHEHIMTGPIVGNGKLIGAVHFARIGQTPAFNYQDITDLSSICMHLSASIAALKTQQAQQNIFTSPFSHLLTPREMQIAKLVAQGLTNKQIGTELWITQNSVKQALKRMFLKLKVSSRTEMVAKL
ncbi:response regulator receiver domain protein [Calothrix parasitica NIES-267]|uniref:Response regulator receiver domain protein n=1 Tax=Calothrix parasitica NIES-267 TaxID=1973488 RepID=A0A1Z4LM26_9CYAN|nr:response regulator receiver domain protein [Calothrix parasitica NIES-267]